MARRPSDSPQPGIGHRLRGLVNSGLWTGVSFGLSVLLGFAMLTEVRSGPILAGLAGLCVYAFLAYGIPNRVGRNMTLDEPAIEALPSSDPRVELLVEAHQHAATLSAARHEVPLVIGEIVNALQHDAHAIIAGVSAQPEKLTAVLRFFTYYLPSTADLVMDRVKLAPHAGRARLDEIDHTLTRLAEAFVGFKAAVLAPDLASVDLDISLLDTALDADLEDLKTR